ncbi:MAG TPA: TRAP transporter small permease [Alphaproteobacteria bacterium]|nr:TRAP transporter small permease [Alphaproteobacteria bacterium]
MALLHLLDSLVRWLGTACLAVAAVFIGLLAILGAADSLGTQLFALPVPSALELSQAGLVVVVFMGLAYAQRRRGHVTVDIITGRLRGRAHMFFTGLALVAAIAFFSLLAWRSGVAAIESVAIDERSWGLTRFPIWPSKIALCFGCVVALMESLRQFVHLCLGNPDAYEAHSPDDEAL